MSAGYGRKDTELIITNLRRGPQQLSDGQVVYSRQGLATGPHYFPYSTAMRPAESLDMRPLTLTEIGPKHPVVVQRDKAVEALRFIQQAHKDNTASKALAEIDALVQDDE